MALSIEQHRIRRALLAIVSVAVVFWASYDSRSNASQSDGGIHWIIDLEGWQAWLFLLLAHLYYSINWKLQRDLIYAGISEGNPVTTRPERDHFLGVKGEAWRKFLARGLTDVVALLGIIFILWNFLIAIDMELPSG